MEILEGAGGVWSDCSRRELPENVDRKLLGEVVGFFEHLAHMSRFQLTGVHTGPNHVGGKVRARSVSFHEG